MREGSAEKSRGAARTAAAVLLGVFAFASTFSIAISQTALAAGFAVWAWLALSGRLPRLRLSGLEIPVGTFFAVSAISAALSPDPGAAFYNLRNYLLFSLIWYAGYAAVAPLVRRRLLVVLIVSGSCSALYGIALFVTGRGHGTFGRVAGPFSTAMTYGGILMILLSLFLAQTIAPRIGLRLRLAAAAASTLCAAALFFSFTRSSWAGMTASAAVILLLTRRRLLVPFFALLVLGVLAMPARYRERVTSMWDPEYRTNVQRINLVKGGISIFLEHPVLGTGPVDLADIYREHMPPEAVHVHGHMHNIFLHVAVTLGSLGLVSFVWMLAAFFRLIAGNLELSLPPPERAWAAGSLGALAGFVVNGLFEWNFGDAEVLALILAVTGSGLAARVGSREGDNGAGNARKAREAI